jgi:hypothetical protein
MRDMKEIEARLSAKEKIVWMNLAVIDEIDSDKPNGEAIRDAMFFSRDIIEARFGLLDMSVSDAQVALTNIARDYLDSGAWGAIGRIAKSAGWEDAVERAADYYVGDIEEALLQEAIKDAMWPDPRAIKTKVKEVS